MTARRDTNLAGYGAIAVVTASVLTTACTDHNDSVFCVYPTFGDVPEGCDEALAQIEFEVSNDPELSFCHEAIVRSREIYACQNELSGGSFGAACSEADLPPETTTVASIDEELDDHHGLIENSCQYLIEVHYPEKKR